MIRNERTGEELDFVVRTPELLAMDVTWTRPGPRAVEHLHPAMTETWRVVDGVAGFRIGGVESTATAGDVRTADPGVVHLAWNAGDTPARLRIEMRPALRWAEFVERLFAGEDPVALLAEFPDEIRLP